MRPLPQVRAMITGKLAVLFPEGTNRISFISNRHSDLRHTSGFELPSSKRLGGNFIEDRVAGALRHHRIRHLPARSIDNHDANTISSNIGMFCLVWVLGQRSAHCHSLGSRQRQGAGSRKDGCLRLHTRSRSPFDRMFLFYWRGWCCWFFWSRGLLDYRCWLFTRCPGCNFRASLRLFLFQLGRWCRLASLYMLREICRSRFLRPRQGGASEHNASAHNGGNSLA